MSNFSEQFISATDDFYENSKNSNVTDIKIQKTDINGTGLAGAIFQLKKLGADGHSESDVVGITGIGTITETINGEQKPFTSAFKTTGEVQTFEGLPDGTYRLYEVHYPAGYVVTFRYIQFTLEKGIMKNIGTDSGNTSIFDFTEAAGNNMALLKIKNTPGVALPQTGGSGTTLMTALGGFMTASAGAVLALASHRRKKNLRKADFRAKYA